MQTEPYGSLITLCDQIVGSAVQWGHLDHWWRVQPVAHSATREWQDTFTHTHRQQKKPLELSLHQSPHRKTRCYVPSSSVIRRAWKRWTARTQYRHWAHTACRPLWATPIELGKILAVLKACLAEQARVSVSFFRSSLLNWSTDSSWDQESTCSYAHFLQCILYSIHRYSVSYIHMIICVKPREQKQTYIHGKMRSCVTWTESHWRSSFIWLKKTNALIITIPALGPAALKQLSHLMVSSGHLRSPFSAMQRGNHLTDRPQETVSCDRERNQYSWQRNSKPQAWLLGRTCEKSAL